MKKQYMNLALTAIVAFGGLVAALLTARFGYEIDLMTVIFFAGSVGAVVNNYFRLSKLSANPAPVADALERPSVLIQMWVSLLLAGILGFVAYGLFLSGLLQGELFPEFNQLNNAFDSIEELLKTVGPKTNLDAAKAIIWAFIAGFSERFIPNVLDTLIREAESPDPDGG